jgi:hypothetical protein
LPAQGEACLLADQVCDYDDDVTGGEDVCTCAGAAGWACVAFPACPETAPASGEGCPAPDQECGYSTMPGGGNEIECTCADDAWACVDENAPPPAP